MVSGIHIRVLLSLGARGLDSLYLGIVVVTKSFLCLVEGHRLSELLIALWQTANNVYPTSWPKSSWVGTPRHQQDKKKQKKKLA